MEPSSSVAATMAQNAEVGGKKNALDEISRTGKPSFLF
jgi:hypothetical protein